MKFFSSVTLIVGPTLLFLSGLMFIFSGITLVLGEMIIEWEVASISSCQIYLTFILDYASAMFSSVVGLIAGSVIIYSTSYMGKEVFFGRFISLVILFVLSMFLLVFSPNLISLLLGWDGLGVSSYLLVIFYQSGKSYNAGMVTALTNRMGDVGLLICVGLMLSFGGWSFFYLSSSSSSLSPLLISLLIISACTKSAQIPFSSWLPAAMAAPTPVSALVHSSTLVTAGVFLLVRFNVLLLQGSASELLMYVGAMTMMMAGLAAMFEMDMKKMIALSTLSQLGVMMMVLGGGMPLLAFFHLLSHAYFKAMLFMCAGMLIHNMKDYQDIRTMSLGLSNMPTVLAILMIANLSLCGLPFLSGFYSKDLVLESLMMGGPGMVFLLVIFIGTALTVAYSCRLSFLVGLSITCSEPMNTMSDEDYFLVLGMLVLLPFAMFGGVMVLQALVSDLGAVFMPVWMKLMILTAIFSGLLAALSVVSSRQLGLNLFVASISALMWFMPTVFSPSLTSGSFKCSSSIKKSSENIWVSLFTHVYVGALNLTLTGYMNYVTSGYFTKSVFILIGLVLLISTL